MSKKLKKNIQEFINKTNPDLLHENANKDSKLIHSHRDLISGIVSRDNFEDEISEDILYAHKNGYIHVHDTDYWISKMTNCCLVNYPDMLQNGFKLGNANISTPNSIGVACTILTQIALCVGSSQYGGQTMADIDIHLEPYVLKSYNKLKEKQKKYNLPDSYLNDEIRKEVHDALQTFLYQVNSCVSCSGQTPFISISFGTSTSPFGRLIQEEYLKVHIDGIGTEHSTPVFPKVIFILDDGINLKETDINYDIKKLAIECSSKRIYPDFISGNLNKKVTGSTDKIVSPMGCRSFLSKWINVYGEEQYFGRANLGVVSINLPLLAFESENESDFFQKISDYMDLSYKAHIERINKLKTLKAKENPLLFTEGVLSRLEPEETIEKILYDGRFSISIGYIGLSECSYKFKNELDKDFCKSILNYMNLKCEQFKKDSSLSFSLYGTPAESLCYKFAKVIENNFPGSLNRDFVTNSFHQPVWVESSTIEKWNYEEGFAYLSSGGNISYVETPNLKNNLKGLEVLIDYAYERIPYFGINQPVDRCYKCNFYGEFTVDNDGFHCPQCNNRDESTMSVIRRVSGYLSAANSRPFNTGKQAEVITRIKHLL